MRFFQIKRGDLLFGVNGEYQLSHAQNTLIFMTLMRRSPLHTMEGYTGHKQMTSVLLVWALSMTITELVLVAVTAMVLLIMNFVLLYLRSVYPVLFQLTI